MPSSVWGFPRRIQNACFKFEIEFTTRRRIYMWTEWDLQSLSEFGSRVQFGFRLRVVGTLGDSSVDLKDCFGVHRESCLFRCSSRCLFLCLLSPRLLYLFVHLGIFLDARPKFCYRVFPDFGVDSQFCVWLCMLCVLCVDVLVASLHLHLHRRA